MENFNSYYDSFELFNEKLSPTVYGTFIPYSTEKERLPLEISSPNLKLSPRKTIENIYNEPFAISPTIKPSTPIILSEYYNNLNPLRARTIPLKSSYGIERGNLGIYKHAYEDGDNNFGYLEETRVVTNISLYGDNLSLTINPVYKISDGLVFYTDNYTRVIVFKNIMCMLSANHLPVKGCVFIPSSNIYIKRTFVHHGYMLEENGIICNKSTGGYMPASFYQLFGELLSDTVIIKF